MNWIVIAMLPSLFWALSNVVDQFMARSYFEQKIAPFLILSGLCTLPVLVALAAWHPDVLTIANHDKLILIGVGAMQICAIIPYLKGIQAEDSSLAVPVFQSIPFLVYLLGWLFLGETMQPLALLGGVIIMAGGIALNWQPETRRVNWKVIGLMGIASTLFAGQAVITRQMVQEVPWYACTFWAFIFWSTSAFVAAFFRRNDWKLIRREVRETKGVALYLCMLQEWLDCIAQVLFALALSLAPTAAHVSFLSGLGPLYVIGLIAIASRFHPLIYAQVGFDRHLVRKVACCLVIFAGLGIFVYSVA